MRDAQKNLNRNSDLGIDFSSNTSSKSEKNKVKPSPAVPMFSQVIKPAKIEDVDTENKKGTETKILNKPCEENKNPE